MSHLRVLICRVEDEGDQMTELASVDLPAVRARRSAAPLDTLETHVATVGQRLLAALCAVQWDEVDTQAVAEYCAMQVSAHKVRVKLASVSPSARPGRCYPGHWLLTILC